MRICTDGGKIGGPHSGDTSETLAELALQFEQSGESLSCRYHLPDRNLSDRQDGLLISEHIYGGDVNRIDRYPGGYACMAQEIVAKPERGRTGYRSAAVPREIAREVMTSATPGRRSVLSLSPLFLYDHLQKM